MKTIEIINGNEFAIDWEFMEIFERHDSNWCVWSIEGEGDDGKRYQASCSADGSEPNDTWSDIEDIEEVTPSAINGPVVTLTNLAPFDPNFKPAAGWADLNKQRS